MVDNRIDRHNYYIDITKSVAQRSTCLRIKYGACIVQDDTIISTGYNGAARGLKNCNDIGECYRVVNNIPHGTQYETCRSVHAEANAIINADKAKMKNATLYLSGIDVTNETDSDVPEAKPCMMCRRMIINAGIKNVISLNHKTGEINIIDVEHDYVINRCE